MVLESLLGRLNQQSSLGEYNLIRSGYPSGSKKGGVYVYYKKHIPLTKRNDICTLDNCLTTAIHSQNEICILTCIYCFQSQNYDEFQNFWENFDKLLNNINYEFQSVQLPQAILMLVIQYAGKMILLTEQV